MSNSDRSQGLSPLAFLLHRLLGRIAEHERNFGITQELWFRGQANRSWRLTPAALRHDFQAQALRHMAGLGSQHLDEIGSGRILEQNLNMRFKRNAASYLRDGNDFVETYFAAQHFGLPTRLLDWTVSPLTAVYFAAQPPDTTAGVVFSLLRLDNYYYSNFEPSGQGIVKAVTTPAGDTHEALVGQLPYLFGDMFGTSVALPANGPDDQMKQRAEQLNVPLFPRTLGGVLPVVPSLRFERMRVQHSRFTFHPPDTEDLQQRVRPEVILQASDKPAIRRDLRRLGVTRSALFPDTEGVATELTHLLAEGFPPVAEFEATRSDGISADDPRLE